MTEPPVFTQDLSALPGYGHGARSVTWWGTWGFILIEGTGFALAFAAYYFLMMQEGRWPPSSPPPALLWGTASAAVMALSEAPNFWTQRMAKQERLAEVRLGLVIMSLVGVAVVIIRGFEFSALNVTWDRNAYGSIVWGILVLHTFHLLTDLADTLVVTALMFTRHGAQGRSFVDVEENAMYWHFVVVSWMLVYAVIYWTARL